ncbi:MAG: hypothetical protein DWI54_00170 [Chloroflexi bacterium]|nr:MAG: hypothetical protein DWI54_00170 [Chloroflexota bacterium]RLT33640.1 MAG: hypothetical protein DWI55_02030 [Chloroflexota bacterium]
MHDSPCLRFWTLYPRLGEKAVISYQLSVISYQLSVISYQLSVIRRQKSRSGAAWGFFGRGLLQ